MTALTCLISRRMFFLRVFVLVCITGYPDPARAQVFDQAVVVSADSLASATGTAILRAGGNAVDAAVATQFMLAVVYPQAGNIGGGGFMVIRMADGTEAAIDFREKAPGDATRDMYLDENGDYLSEKSKIGALASGVPGAVDGMYRAHQRFGKLPWADVVAPAIKAAEEGFMIQPGLASSLNNNKERFEKYGSASFLGPGNDEFRAGQVWKQPSLAETLRRISENGRDGFYSGQTAEMITTSMEANGGNITKEDLAAYESVWRIPLTTTFQPSSTDPDRHHSEYELIMMPLPSSGGIVISQILAMIAPYDLYKMGHNSPEYIHLLTEAMRRSFADRNHHLGDSDFVDVPVMELLKPEYLRHRMADYNPGRSRPSIAVRAGNPRLQTESLETTHLGVIDASGNAVAMTVTLNGSFGSHLEIPGAGFLMNNEMDDFSAKPGEPNMFGLTGTEANAIAPGKRMLSSMSPTIAVVDGKVIMVLGAAGGPRIITAVLQGFLNAAVFGMDGYETVNAPRFHHQWLPDEIRIEHGVIDASKIFRLEMMGHKIIEGGRLASANYIILLPDGRLNGAPDSRVYGTASGY